MAAFAPRYMARFRCIAEACEDTCCAGLTVPISEERWALLRQKVAGGPDAARVEALVTPNPDGATGSHAGILGKRADGHCAFLDEARLCSLQRQHGEAVLPDGCAVFPRVITRWGTRPELAGSLACPETARLCLLADDALVREPVPEALLSRPQVARQVASGDDAWTAHADPVREAMLRLLARQEVPFAARLYALGRLARDLGAFYFPGTTAFGGATTSPVEEASESVHASGTATFESAAEPGEARLARVLSHYEDAGVLQALRAELEALELPGGPWAGICGAVLRSRAAAVSSPRFLALVDAVHVAYGGASPDDAWRLHAARRTALEARYGERVHRYFLHHALNHVLRHPFTEASSVLHAVFLLVLRASVARWVFVGHPAALTDDGAALDAAAVEAFQLVAKHVEQAAPFLDFARGLAGEGPETFARLLILVKGL